MHIAVFSQAYPSEEMKYNYSFVHRRAIQYDRDHDVRVFVPNKKLGIDYEIEGVSVSIRHPETIKKSILDFAPDVLFVHAPISRWEAFDYSMLDIAEQVQAVNRLPILTWIHGYEAISRLLYYPSDIMPALSNGIGSAFRTGSLEITRNIRNLGQLKNIRGYLIRRDNQGDHTIFVSEWLRKAVERSIRTKISNYSVIPNPIDQDLFEYREPNPEKAANLLSIRPFSSRKYANDLSIKAMGNVDGVHLDLYGKGKYLENCRELSKQVNANISFHPRFLHQQEIADLHRDYGVYLTPSRTDAQGVSMCEAMSSGLPVITSDVGGIPEFVEDGKTGFLCQNHKEISDRIRYFRDNPDEVVAMGQAAAESIREKCGTKQIIESEIETAKSVGRR